jgi:hypothetical protein
MKKILTREEMYSHIESMAKKNCFYAALCIHLNSAKKETKEKFYQILEEQKFDNTVDFDIYLEKSIRD